MHQPIGPLRHCAQIDGILPLSYALLTARLSAAQAASRTARIAARLARPMPRPKPAGGVEALVALLCPPCSTPALHSARGSFHAAAAAVIGGNTPARSVKGAFTFAF